MIAPDEKYQGTVVRGTMTRSKVKGTTGFEVLISVAETNDSIFHTVWITAGNRENAKRDLIALGADATAFEQKEGETDDAFRARTTEYLHYKLADDVAGTSVTFGTKAEEYNGKTYTRIKWIGAQRSASVPATSDQLADAALILAGFEPAIPADPTAPIFSPADDSDIPFALFLAPLLASMIWIIA